MTYYDEKKRAFDALEEFLSKNPTGVSINEIIYAVTKSSCVSELSIKKRIDLLCDIGRVKIDGSFVKWI